MGHSSHLLSEGRNKSKMAAILYSRWLHFVQRFNFISRPIRISRITNIPGYPGRLPPFELQNIVQYSEILISEKLRQTVLRACHSGMSI